jgi:hypothetical protein
VASATTEGTVTVQNHALTLAQMPPHFHRCDASSGGNSNTDFQMTNTDGGNDDPFAKATSTVGSGQGHTHGASFTGAAHTHTFTGDDLELEVQYVNAIICTKD